MTNAEKIKEARLNAGLSASEAAALVGVKTLTWQRWEGQTSRATEIPYAHWNLFLLLTGKHPVYRIESKDNMDKVFKIGADMVLPEGVKTSMVSDGYHTFGELYDHRISLFLALMSLSAAAGLKCGWSRKHDDGKPCFGGGWVVGWIETKSGLQARYHMEDSRPLPPSLEKPLGSPWNGQEETLLALKELTGN